MILASGNQRKKLYMTTAAMKVLPKPVGRTTSVFRNKHSFTILNCIKNRVTTLKAELQIHLQHTYTYVHLLSRPTSTVQVLLAPYCTYYY